MLKINIAVLVLLFSVLVVVVDVLCTLIVAVLADHIKRWLVVSVEFKTDLSTIKPASSGSEAGWMGDFGVVSLDGWID
jgi:hypothetical protein